MGGGDEPENIRLVHENYCHDRIEGLTDMMNRPPTDDQVRWAYAFCEEQTR